MVSHTYTFDAATDVGGAYAVTVTDRAGNQTTVPWAVYADHLAPTVTLTVPERLVTTTIPVQWSAAETGSGLRGYDLELSADGGQTWTGLLTETLDTDYPYPGEMGRAYTFRVRATDHVSNTGAWVTATAKTVMVKKYYSVAVIFRPIMYQVF